jgi:hypothetical protein
MRTLAFLAALPVFVLVALILAKRLGLLAAAPWGQRFYVRSRQSASEQVLNQVSEQTALDLPDLPLDSFPPRF